ncbi:hypothetical protein OPQ81_009823 [Rhizoctonia solani]|nr:hypothetical protein OPQ81_009823 [Rhizoctonia solani]
MAPSNTPREGIQSTHYGYFDTKLCGLSPVAVGHDGSLGVFCCIAPYTCHPLPCEYVIISRWPNIMCGSEYT